MNEVRLVPSRAEASIKRYVLVEGAEILDLPGFDALLPSFMSVGWSYDLGDTAWKMTWLNVAGARIKKDGKPGERTAGVLFSENDMGTAPDWVRRFAAETKPQQVPYT